jgi:formate-dependent nitrite reductase membrane component NrfD
VVIAASVISLLAILLATVLLVRFFKRPVAAFHRAITNQIANRFAAESPASP